jgi:hypothetical protein
VTAPFRPSYDWVQRVQQMPGVRAKLREVADRKARQAALIAQSQGVAVPITREDGTRPKGRSFSRVALPATAEFGDSKTKRLRILGQVVGR